MSQKANRQSEYDPERCEDCGGVLQRDQSGIPTCKRCGYSLPPRSETRPPFLKPPRYVDLRPYLEANPEYFDRLRIRLSSHEDAKDLDRIEYYGRQLAGSFSGDGLKHLDGLLRVRCEAGTDIYSLTL